jgi:transposase
MNIRGNLMNKFNKNPKKVPLKLSSNSTKEPTGQPVYTANLNAGGSKIKLEILNLSNNPCHEFDQSPEAIEALLVLLDRENVKGVKLKGKKGLCRLIAEKLLKKGIRPLIADLEKQKIKSSNNGLKGMPVIDEYVAGIDIGQSVIYVAIPPNFDDEHTRVFGTFTVELESIISWLKKHNIKSVSMESTSVYWLPLYELCEKNNIKAIIVNPKHVKMLPGRKTDVLDSQWLMRLHACGLLKGGFIPPQEIRALRDLARHRHDLMDRSGDCLNRIHKMLEIMNVKIGSVLSDISGKSGLSIIRAIVDGERDVKKLAQLVDKRCKCTKEELEKSLQGSYREECIFIMKQEMEIHEIFNKAIEQTELKIKKLLEELPDVTNLPSLPRRTKRHRNKKEYNRSPYCFDLRPLLYKKFGHDLTVVNGIEEASAAVILFETGGNFDAFPTLKHFASWCAVSPGNKVSGGKHISGKGPKKFSRVGQAFRVAANANYKSKNATGAFMRRLENKGKSGKSVRKATAHKICGDVYNIVKHGKEHYEQSAIEYEAQFQARKIMMMTKTLNSLGYTIINTNTGLLMEAKRCQI